MRMSRPVAVLAAALALVPATAPHADAAGRREVRRGTDGCFAWSWGDAWAWKATVYVSNRCARAHTVKIAWHSSAFKTTALTVGGHQKASTSQMSDPESIWDAGPA